MLYFFFPFIVQDKLRFDPESEIATTGLRVSLICPVSTLLWHRTSRSRASYPCLTHTLNLSLIATLFSCPFLFCSWWRCDSGCPVGFWLVPICNVSTQSSSYRWTRRSPRGPAPSVISLPLSSSSLSMGKERETRSDSSAEPNSFQQIPTGWFCATCWFKPYLGTLFKVQGCPPCCA